MLHPDITAALAAEKRSTMLAEAARYQARSDLALSRRLSRHHASRPARVVARLAMRPRPMLRSAGPPLPACENC